MARSGGDGAGTTSESRTTFADRLRLAIERQPSPPGSRRRGIALFHSRLRERAVELGSADKPSPIGYGLATIHAYLHGESEPSITFLEEASRVLGVRAAWLTHGHGAPTEAEELARVAQEAKEGDAPARMFERALWRPLSVGDGPGEAARAAILGLWSELLRTDDPHEVVEDHGGGAVETRGFRVAHAVTRALRAPLNELEEHWSHFPREEMDAYLVLLAEGLRQYLRGSWRAELAREVDDATEA